MRLESIRNVVDIEVLRGAHADLAAAPDLLVEVPHGADERGHYDTLRARLTGKLPEDLHLFFQVNTDVGAYAYGREAAARLVHLNPNRSALVVRSLIPRTFVDCNRPADFGGGKLDEGGLTAGIPAYVRDPGDLELLRTLHRDYVDVAARAYQWVCGEGGLALVPHTYGPRSLGIPSVDDDIVEKLRWACAPERIESWPLRAEVDLLTRDGAGTLFAPPCIEDALLGAFEAAGFVTKTNDTYHLHSSSLAHVWSTAYPGKVTCLEVRRDLLVADWDPFEPRPLREARVAGVAAVLAPVLEDALRRCAP